jgi:hypothetical protein
MGTSGVDVGVGSGVSVGTAVSVEIAKVGKREGSITGAAGGTKSDQLQANTARSKTNNANNRLGMLPPESRKRTLKPKTQSISTSAS